MFTKLFKKSHDPYELGGRWYKVVVDKPNAKVIESDLPEFTIVSASASYIDFSLPYEVIDCFVKKTTFISSASATSILARGSTGITSIKNGNYRIQSGTSADICEFYLRV